MGQRLHDVLPDDVAEGTIPAIEIAIATHEVRTYTYQLKMDDGVHSYEARLVALGDDEVLCNIQDLTARMRHYGLTPREVEFLRLMAVGITDNEIGERLDISALTARKHVGCIRKKMAAASRTQAAVKALRDRLIR